MKNPIKLLCLFGTTLAIAVTTSFSQFAVTYTFDENGNASGSLSTVPFTIAPDPVNGIATLVYVLSFPVTPGDVLVSEIGSQTTSDLLRFFNDLVWVFSEQDPGDLTPDLADVGLPPLGALPVVGPFPETGVEGNNGIAYTPTPGQPGSVTGMFPPDTTITYNFISDAIPEPSTYALLAVGAAGLLGLARRKRVRA